MTPRPKCEVCGKETSRVSSRGGKGIYKCTNTQCSNFLKKPYARQSSPKGIRTVFRKDDSQ